MRYLFVYLLNILSIFIYGLLFLRDGVLFRKGEHEKLRKTFFLVLCFFQCWVIATIRVGIGTDYGWYSQGFSKMAETGFSELTYMDWEFGFVLLNKIVALFTRKTVVFIGLCAALSLAGMFYLIWRFSGNPFMSVFLFLNTYLFYLDMNFVRQSIAMSVMCFAYGFLQDRKIWKYLLLCALAAVFHYTALYMVPVLFVTFIKLNLKTLPIYAAAVALYFVLIDVVVKLMLNVIYKEYQGTKWFNVGVKWVYAIYPLLISLGVIAVAFYLRFDLSRRLNVLMHLMLLMGFWQIAMIKISIFERFSYYTMSFIVIAVPEFISAFKDKYSERSDKLLEKRFGEDSTGLEIAKTQSRKKQSRVVLIISAAVLVLTFAYNMMGLIGPKNGVHGVLPYRSRYAIDIPNIDSWFKG